MEGFMCFFLSLLDKHIILVLSDFLAEHFPFTSWSSCDDKLCSTARMCLNAHCRVKFIQILIPETEYYQKVSSCAQI